MLQILSSIFAIFFFTCTLFQSECHALESPNKFIKNKTKHSLQQSFPPAQGWSFEKLARALFYAEEAGSSAVVILHKGRLVAEWGKTTLRIKSRSVRKSLLSALYGIAVEKKLIDLSITLDELGIDDRPPCLTVKEKKATIADLIKSRSGIYHPAAAESKVMKTKKPPRGRYIPGEYWYYNNWDFNALGTIFERKTNKQIGQAFIEWIAAPIGMEDFRVQDVEYKWESTSMHPAYYFWISPRDLARFGQLYLQKGLWGSTQVIPAIWVNESTTPHSKTSNGGYGYMWWINSDSSYYASGFMGQKILVIPKHEIVIVNSVFTGGRSFPHLSPKALKELSHFISPVDPHEFRQLVELILEAAPSESLSSYPKKM